jgi:Tol biopolymer transport system component
MLFAVSLPSCAGAPRAQIAFTSTRNGKDETYVMNADGTNQISLTKNPGRDWQPSWSPF